MIDFSLSKASAAGLCLTAEDMFWANLAGSMEAVDAGTTTTLDHAHMNWSKQHSLSPDSSLIVTCSDC
jgi:hypothetical protein